MRQLVIIVRELVIVLGEFTSGEVPPDDQGLPRRRVSASGATSLPDGARVLIGAWRAFRQLPGDVRANNIGGLGVDRLATVHGGHFSGSIPINENTLTAGIDPSADPEGPMAAIDPTAVVCARFITGRDVVTNGPWEQPHPGRPRPIGSWGQRLRGSKHVMCSAR